MTVLKGVFVSTDAAFFNNLSGLLRDYDIELESIAYPNLEKSINGWQQIDFCLIAGNNPETNFNELPPIPVLVSIQTHLSFQDSGQVLRYRDDNELVLILRGISIRSRLRGPGDYNQEPTDEYPQASPAERSPKAIREIQSAYDALEREQQIRKRVETHRDILSTIIEESTDVVGYTDIDLNVLYLNKAGLELFGVENDEKLAKLNPFGLHHEDDYDLLNQEAFPTAIKLGSWRGETNLKGTQGRTIPVSHLLLYKKFPDGTGFYASIARDIRDLKAKERELESSQRLYRTLAEAAQDLIFVISEDDKVIYLNSYAAKAIGKNPAEVINTPRSLVFPEDVSKHQYLSIQKVLETGEPFYAELETPFPGGSLWLGTSLVPIFGEDGKPTSVLGISRNIGREKESMARLNEALLQEKELGDLKSRFVSMTSHEFKTPLSTILSSIELLETYGHLWTEDKRLVHFSRIKNAVENMNALLEDILALGRIESGKVRWNPVWLDPIEFCTELTEEIILSDHHQHEIHLDVEGTCKKAYIDQEVLRHIVQNVMSNAIKYSNPGSIVEFKLQCLEDKLDFEISDQGIGISSEDMPKVFEAFFRGQNIASTSGSGLGLAIVKSGVDLCGGTITLEKNNQGGTLVKISLPVRIQTG